MGGGVADLLDRPVAQAPTSADSGAGSTPFKIKATGEPDAGQ